MRFAKGGAALVPIGKPARCLCNPLPGTTNNVCVKTQAETNSPNVIASQYGWDIFLCLPAYVQPKKAAEKFSVTKFYEKWYT